MVIRPEQIEDYEAISEVNKLAFGRENEAGLIERLRDEPSFHPGLSLVAELDNQVVGHILFSLIEIQSDSSRLPALALAPLAVRPERQRQGVGVALIEQGLQACHKLGHHCIIVVGHPEYYSRFGFQPAARFNILPPFPVPDEAFMALGLPPGGLHDVQGTVIYPAAFRENEGVLNTKYTKGLGIDKG